MNGQGGLASNWRRLCNGLDALGRFIVGGSILAIVVITVVAVWYRYVLNAPLSWTEQVSRILFVWSVFAGAAVLYRSVLHIVIDMFVLMAPVGVQRALFWVNHGLMLLVGLFMVVYGMEITIGTWGQTFGALEISPASFYSAGPFCGVLILFFWVEKVLDPARRDPVGDVHI